MRSEFEKIEWVKERLNHVWWSQNNEYCDTGKHPKANASFLNGALHSFQHQQSKIDELQKRVDAVTIVLDGLKRANYMNSSNKAYNSLLIEKLEQAIKGGGE